MAKIDTNVGHLVDMIERGELSLAGTSPRRYIWPATRVRDLLDSRSTAAIRQGRSWFGRRTRSAEPSPRCPTTLSAFTPKLLLDSGNNGSLPSQQ